MALKVRSGFKRYGNGELILRNLNMTVGHGEIYGLLGASGCGKTTLFACIVGLRKFDRGEITVLGRFSSGAVGPLCGFMPQDFALLQNSTIAEILTYFGRIYGMKSSEIKTQIDFLITFLDLPPVNKSIQNLSGGQKRRISIAVAIIHNPQILIMDEPTVGLDPVLRQRIWDHLFQISRLHGTTILISTHYIEETRQCNTIGFLRGGQLLVEDNPESLLSKFQLETLEAVTLELCRKDDICKTNNFGMVSKSLEPVEIRSYRKLSISQQQERSNLVPNVKPNNIFILQALVSKWCNRHRHDWRLLLSELIVPIMVMVVFQNVVGLKPKTLNVGVIIDNLDENIQLDVYCKNLTVRNECLENVGVCNFIQHFDGGEFNWIPVNSYEEGLRKIKQGSAMGLVEFPENFSNHTKNRILYRNFVEPESILGSTIKIRMDESNIILSSYMKSSIVEKYLVFINSVATACSYNPEIYLPAVQLNAIYGSNETGSWVWFVQPGTVIVILFIAANMSGIMWADDRLMGLEDRDFVAGVKLWHRMVSSFLTHSVLTLLLIVMCFAILMGMYSMEIKGSWFLAVGIVYISCMSGVTISWMIATVRDSLMEAIVMIVFLTFLHGYSSGLVSAIEMGSWTYRLFSERLPATYMIEAFRSICTRGWGLSHPIVGRGFLTGIGWIMLSILVCILVERKKYK